jgi:hypothetical protein
MWVARSSASMPYVPSKRTSSTGQPVRSGLWQAPFSNVAPPQPSSAASEAPSAVLKKASPAERPRPREADLRGALEEREGAVVRNVVRRPGQGFFFMPGK